VERYTGTRIGFGIRCAVSIASLPIIVLVAVAFLSLTIMSMVLVAPTAWAMGCPMRQFWGQTNIAFWQGKWMSDEER
jgi:hypothetical protein